MKTFAAAMIAIVATAASAQMPAPQSVVDGVRKNVAPDKRQIVCEINASETEGKVVLSGKTSEAFVRDSMITAFNRLGLNAVDSIKILPDTLWALPRISVCHLRMKPGHEAEMGSQALMGNPVRLLEVDDEGWWRVQTPDGYIAYVIDNSLTRLSDAQMRQWRESPRLIVTAPHQTYIYATADSKALRNIVSDVVMGNILEGTLSGQSMAAVKLPDGRTGYIDPADVEPLDSWARQPFDADKILDLAYSMEGSPYFWGGTSVKNLDCSGLSKTSYFYNGIILMRDASQQATTGLKIKPEEWQSLEPGDLLFFGNPKTGRVTHVAIHHQDGDYVHSSARVRRNSVNPDSPAYLTTPFLSASRIKTHIGTRGITRVEDHPWYFSK